MNAGAVLVPNFGAEEGAVWRDRVGDPALQTVARLWGLLFSHSSRILGTAADIPWPAAFGSPAPAPIFPWLEDAGRVEPWLATSEIREDPRLAGLPVGGAPPDVVRRVHDKAFAWRAALDAGVAPRCLRPLIDVFEPDDLRDADTVVRRIEERLAAWPAAARAAFTLKPRLGSTGRGRVPGSDGRADTAAIRGALPRLAHRGGAVLEPWLERTLDLSAQVYVEPTGGTVLLGTLEQLLTRSGVYRGHRGLVDSRGRIYSGNDDHDESLREAGAALATAAAREGYAGPAGVDAFAFLWRDADEPARQIFRPVVELNARYTLGTVAIGLVRRALVEAKGPLGLEPGNRRAFLFSLTEPAGGWDAATDRAGTLARLVPLWMPGSPVRPALLFAETADGLDATAGSLTTGAEPGA